MNIEELILGLIEQAEKFGLHNIDLENSSEMLKYHEYYLSVDIILTQLHEYDIKVDKEFYNLALAILKKLDIDSKKYNYLEEIIM